MIVFSGKYDENSKLFVDLKLTIPKCVEIESQVPEVFEFFSGSFKIKDCECAPKGGSPSGSDS